MKISKYMFGLSLFIAFAFLVALFVSSFIFVQKSEISNNNQNSENSILTAIEVAKHNKLSDCWMIIGTKVYDITPYTNSHPGGNAELEKGCGIDATRLYDTKDKTPGNDHSAQARSMLDKYYIGELGQKQTSNKISVTPVSSPSSSQSSSPTSFPSSTSTNNQKIALTLDEVKKHNKLSDCWMLIGTKIYDITPYTNSHPGGNAELEKGCGIDATRLYDTRDGTGSHSSNARSMLSQYYIGDLNQQLSSTDLNTKISTIQNTTPLRSSDDDDYEDDD